MRLQCILSRLEQSGSDDDKHQQTLEDTGFWGKMGAGGLFLAQNSGRILFALRSKHVQEPNTWGTFGGAADEGENPKQAAHREMVEETGYKGTIKMIPMFVFRHSSGFQYHNFLAIIPKEFRPRLDWENSGFKWVDFGDWPNPLHPGAKTLLVEDYTTIEQHVEGLK